MEQGPAQAQVLLAKYGDICELDLRKRFCTASYAWRSFLEGYRMLKKGLTQEVGDVGSIYFFMDIWLEERSFVELCLVVVPPNELRQSLASYLSYNLPWESIPFIQIFPSGVLNKLQLVTSFEDGGDKPRQRWEGCGIFSSKSTYLKSLPHSPTDHKCWKKLWDFKGPMHLSLFLWQGRQRSLKTRTLLLLGGWQRIPIVGFVRVLWKILVPPQHI